MKSPIALSLLFVASCESGDQPHRYEQVAGSTEVSAPAPAPVTPTQSKKRFIPYDGVRPPPKEDFIQALEGYLADLRSKNGKLPTVREAILSNRLPGPPGSVYFGEKPNTPIVWVILESVPLHETSVAVDLFDASSSLGQIMVPSRCVSDINLAYARIRLNYKADESENALYDGLAKLEAIRTQKKP